MQNPKPKRGDCGTCHWFERQPGTTQGFCMVRPPVPIIGMQQVPGSSLAQRGPQVMPAVQGMIPPTDEMRRCAEWWPAGMQPPKIATEVREGTVQ